MKYAQIVNSYQKEIQKEGRIFHIHQQKNVSQDASWQQNVCQVCTKNNQREHVRFKIQKLKLYIFGIHFLLNNFDKRERNDLAIKMLVCADIAPIILMGQKE